ncbi:MAG: hypothetical protein JWO98_4936 [Frankiales bacterium]|nr:hypothetical protein [Frankiales bacterium]
MQLNPATPPPGWPTEAEYNPDAAPAPKPVLPPGMVWAMAGDGSVIPAYAMQPEPDKTPAHSPPQKDVWPPRLLAGGISTGVVIGAIGYAGPGLGQAGHAVEMAGIGVGIACASVGALVMLVKGGMGRQAGQHVNVSVNVTNTAHGGSATAKSRGSRR